MDLVSNGWSILKKGLSLYPKLQHSKCTQQIATFCLFSCSQLTVSLLKNIFPRLCSHSTPAGQHLLNLAHFITRANVLIFRDKKALEIMKRVSWGKIWLTSQDGYCHKILTAPRQELLRVCPWENQAEPGRWSRSNQWFCSKLAQMLGLASEWLWKNLIIASKTSKAMFKMTSARSCSTTSSLKAHIFILIGQFHFSLWLQLK